MNRCLFVDDSGLIRKVAKRILSGAGVTVIEAQTAEEALGVCGADMPDLIVLDAQMPGVDSAELIRHLRAIPCAVKPRILLCLVEMDVAAIMRAKRAGAQGYLLKPFDRQHLLSSLGGFRSAA